MANNEKNILKIIQLLKKHYPDAKVALNYKQPFDLLAAVILSAQCTDERVNIVTKELFKKYHSIKDYADADLKELEQDVRSTGFYHNKAKNIIGAAKMILSDFGGKIPDNMEDITKLPGVARKTGNIVLGNIYNVIEGIAVDTHVIRLSGRLGLTPAAERPRLLSGTKGVLANRRDVANFKGASGSYRRGSTKNENPEKIEADLMKIVPKEDWFNFSYLIQSHGRKLCMARNPQCRICFLNKICKYEGKNG